MNENIPKMSTRIRVKGKELEEMKSKSITKNFFLKLFLHGNINVIEICMNVSLLQIQGLRPDPWW